MIELKTGRFVLREGVELYPGMTRQDFFNSPLYKNELYNEKDKEDETIRTYDIKDQNINGYLMSLEITISRHDYVEMITLTKPEYHNWPKWPLKENQTHMDYAREIEAYNDEFLDKEIIDPDEIMKFHEWGSITSSFSFREVPQIFIEIRYDEIPFLEARGFKFETRFKMCED